MPAPRLPRSSLPSDRGHCGHGRIGHIADVAYALSKEGRVPYTWNMYRDPTPRHSPLFVENHIVDALCRRFTFQMLWSGSIRLRCMMKSASQLERFFQSYWRQMGQVHPQENLACEPTRNASDHFGTEHLLSDLAGRSLRGGLATATSQVARFTVQICAIAVLARLLAPEVFGLVAMATVITGAVVAFKDAGLSMATVQRNRIDHEQLSTLFWLNVGISVFLTILIVATAPIIAWAFGRKELVAITIVLAGAFILGGLTVQHQALLRRQMRFGTLAVIGFTSMASGVLVAIAMAFAGAGYWALVAMPITSTAVNALSVWWACSWRPGWPTRFDHVGPMLGFGGHLTAANLLNYSCRNLDNFLIGVSWGAGPLGLYSKAYQLLLLPVTQINAPVSAVMIPALSRLQGDVVAFRNAYRRAISALAALGMPVVVYTFVVAEELIVLILGEPWIGATPVFRALAPAAFLGTISVATGWVTIPLGRTDRELRSTFWGAAAIALGFLAGLPWGIVGVATAYSAVTLVIRVPQLVYVYRGSPVGIRDVFHAVARPAIASLTAGIVLGLVVLPATSAQSLAVQLGLHGLAFASVYLALLWLLPFGCTSIPSLSRLRMLLFPSSPSQNESQVAV